MPLTGSESILSAAIKAALLADPRTKATDDAALPEDEKSLTPFCDAIAAAIVAHIVANAVVTVPPGVAVATAGSAVAQVGATTAPGIGALT